MSDETGATGGRPSRVGRALEGALLVAALTAVSLTFWGTAIEAMAKFLPVIHRLADPGLYPGDAEVDAAARLLGWSLWAFVPFERLGALDAALFAGTLLARATFAGAALLLARSLTADRWEALGAATLLLVTHPRWGTVGSYQVLGAEPLASHLAMPLGVVALAMALQGRLVLAGALTGLGANLHPMTLFALMPALLGVADESRARVRAALAAAVAAAPVLAWTALNGVTDVGHDAANVPRLTRLVAAAHLYWSMNSSAARAGFLAALALAALCAWPSAPGTPGRRALRGLAWAAAAVAVYVVLSEADRAPLLLLKAHALRVSLWTGVLARALIGLQAVRELRHGGASGAFTASLLVAGCVGWPELLGPAGICLALGRRRRRELPWPVALCLGALPVALLASQLGATLLPAMGRAALLAIIVLAARAIALRSGSIPARLEAWRGARATVVVASGLMLLLVLRGEVGPVGVRVAASRVAWRPEALHAPDRVGVARFAAERTPRTARFLVHPDDSCFLAYGRRSMVASVALMTFAIWDLRRADERLRRVQELGFGRGRPHAYQSWSAARVEALAIAQRADYVVMERTPGAPRLGWPTAYENRRFVVYRRP